MRESVGEIVAAAAHMSADEADPEVSISVAGLTVIRCGMIIFGAIEKRFCGRQAVLRVSADWTTAASPFLETAAVEDMLAQDCEEACTFVHAF